MKKNRKQGMEENTKTREWGEERGEGRDREKERMEGVEADGASPGPRYRHTQNYFITYKSYPGLTI